MAILFSRCKYCDAEKFTEMAGLQLEMAVSHEGHSVASYLGHPIFVKAAIDDETLSLRLNPSTPLSLFLLSHTAHGRCLTAHETV